MAVAVYCRISDDRTGRAAGVARQQDDCRELCHRRGWPVSDVYTDNDRSAYSGRPRPNYLRLCADIAAGQVTHVVAWHPDRLHRSPRELEDFIDLIDAHRVQVETVRAGEWDLSTPSGRLNARLLGSVARFESEHKSDRVRSALKHNAAEGRPHGGNRPYGYQADGVTVHPVEAANVAHAASRVLQGDSLRSICAAFDTAGHPSATGKKWTPTALRNILLRPRTAGLRAHLGTVVGPASWPPLLDSETWQAVCAVLKDDSRRDVVSSARVHLLTNLARCGLCDTGLLPQRNRNAHYYGCRGCYRISIRRQPLEELVVGTALGWLGELELRQPAPDVADDDSARQLVALRARRELAVQSFTSDPDVTPDLLRTLVRQFTVQIAELERAQAKLRSDQVLQSLSGADVAAQWEEADLARRRVILNAVCERIAVNPAAVRGARKFDPLRVEIKQRWG